MRAMILLPALALLWAGWIAPAAQAAATGAQANAAARLAAIEKERKRLLAIRQRLEAQLGDLGRQMRRLDRALVRARKAREEADADVRRLDAELARLTRRSDAIRQQMRRLREALLREARAAWMNGAAHSAARATATVWLDALAGGEMASAPHRAWLLARVMASQQRDRERLAALREELAAVTRRLAERRQALVAARERKRSVERELAARMAEKRKLAKRLRQELHRHEARATALAREREALKRLLDGLDAELLALDARLRAVSVRKRKGRLHWPLKGRIVASFHSRSARGHARLNGVRIAPLGANREVRAMAAGQVRYADWFGGYGLMMIVDYGDGVLGVYAHNDALFKQLGDWVEEGEVIARAGSTGLVERTRLYFEIRDRGRPVNPRLWCRR